MQINYYIIQCIHTLYRKKPYFIHVKKFNHTIQTKETIHYMFAISPYYQGETTRELKCVKCHWRVPRGGERKGRIIEEHCNECHRKNKETEVVNGCIICNKGWTQCT